MGNQSEAVNNNINKQRVHTLAVLWLFPLLIFVTNTSWNFFNSIRFKQAEKERLESAKAAEQLLSIKSYFPFILANSSSKFYTELEAGTMSFNDESQKDNFISLIKNREEKYFDKNLPRHELYVFKIKSNEKSAELFYSNNETVKDEKELSTTFESLINEVSEENIPYLKEKRIKNEFVWNYFKNSITKDIFGYIVFVDKKANQIGKHLAIKEFENSEIAKTNRFNAAFIPIINISEPIYASEELLKKPCFYEFIKQWTNLKVADKAAEIRNQSINSLGSGKSISSRELLEAEITLQNTIFNNHSVFFNVSPFEDYTTVLFSPITGEASMPLWLKVLNISLIFIMILVVFRGIKYNKWPQQSFQSRLQFTYVLAFCLPLLLLGISAQGYLFEYTRASTKYIQSRLKSSITFIDSQKTAFHEKYESVISKITEDQLAVKAFRELESTNREADSSLSLEAKNTLSRAVYIAQQHDNGQLPLISLSIIDEFGNMYSNLGNSFCPYSKGVNGEEHIDNTFRNDSSYNGNDLKNKNQQVFEKDISLFASVLRKRIKETKPEFAKWNHEIELNQTPSRILDIESEIGKIHNCSSKLNTYSRIYDFVYVDGVPRFVICIIWNEQDLDYLAINSGIRYYAMEEPEIDFSVYKIKDYGIAPWMVSKRYGEEHQKISRVAAEQAYFNKTSEKISNEKFSVTSVPSKAFSDTIIVGGIFRQNLNNEIFVIYYLIVVIIIVSIVVLLMCQHYSAKFFIAPVKSASENTKNEAYEVIPEKASKLMMSLIFTSLIPVISAIFIFN